jgi:hypothetical protein
MIPRPLKSDFGMRYLHKSLPPTAQNLIENLNYISSFSALFERVAKTEKAFNEAVRQVKNKIEL